jgi:hypothetical protein
MAGKPIQEFGKRRPPAPQRVTREPVKRSGHVGLLLMGTLAVGGGAYALMPRGNCEPPPPGMASPAPGAECPPRGSSSGGSGGGGSSSRSSFYSGDSSSSHAASGTTNASPGGVTRGGFGSFAHSFMSHFSGGG